MKCIIYTLRSKPLLKVTEKQKKTPEEKAAL